MDSTDTPENIDQPTTLNSPSAIGENFHTSNFKLLDKLPNELLIMITELLPASSAACLAFTSKTMCDRLGTKYFEELEEGKRVIYSWLFYEMNYPRLSFTRTAEEEERQTFLQLLDKDFTNLIFCHFCQKLHTSKTKGSSFAPCYSANITTQSYGLDGYTYARIALAMKLHRLGLETGTILDKLSRSIFDVYVGYNYGKSLIARIVSDRFYLRTQHQMILVADSPLQLPAACMYDMRLCWHLQNWHDSRRCLSKYVRCRLSHRGEENRACKFCVGPKQCKECLTEYQIDIKSPTSADQGKYTIFITVWQRFGEVRSPFDPEWGRHYAMYGWVQPEFGRGSIKKVFADINQELPPQMLIRRGIKSASKSVARSRKYL